jgi:hypothetical protein
MGGAMRKLVLPLLTCLAASAQAAPPPSLRAVQASITANGVARTIQSLDRSNQWDAVMDRIGRGDPAWIALAPKLAAGADGAKAEGLGIMLAKALPVNPAAVLRVLTANQYRAMSVDRVCGIPFIEPPPGADAAYKTEAVAAVTRVATPGLISVREKCLARLTS